MDRKTFRQCPNGHWYQGLECPYCKAKNNESHDDNVISPQLGASKDKICPHGHSYGRQLNCCPYCGEEEIVAFTNIGEQTLWPASLIITFNHSIVVCVDGAQIKKGFLLEVNYHGVRDRTDYRIFESPINYKSVIRIGDNVFTGKEFINWVDLMINAKMIDNH